MDTQVCYEDFYQTYRKTKERKRKCPTLTCCGDCHLKDTKCGFQKKCSLWKTPEKCGFYPLEFSDISEVKMEEKLNGWNPKESDLTGVPEEVAKWIIKRINENRKKLGIA